MNPISNNNILMLSEAKLAALTILNLSSKYLERIAFKVSDLSFLVGVKRSSEFETSEKSEESYEFRRIENEVLRQLEFRIGGQTLMFDSIVSTVKSIQPFLPSVDFKESPSSVKSKATQISMNYSRYESVSEVTSTLNEEIVVASVYLAVKYEEKRLGQKLMTNEAF